MRMLRENGVEVDMIPLIDIVVLILLFLIITGDMASNTNSVKMKLPRADQARADPATPIRGRVVVQLARTGQRYCAVVEGHSYQLVAGGDGKALETWLAELIVRRGGKPGSGGKAGFPVKLRIPADAPMREVEKVVLCCARVGLTDIHYAAEKVQAR